MSDWSMRRFWTTATAEPFEGGYQVLLDAKAVRTPGKALLSVPVRGMAQRIADEWNAQSGKVDPATMPWTRSANTAIDKVAAQRGEIEDHLVTYAGTDLLCYRATGPEALVQRQAGLWDPVLTGLSDRYDVRLAVTTGVMPVLQDPAAMARLKGALAEMSDFALTGFHDLVALSGSFALALAVADRVESPADGWSLSRVDEDWQIEEWGEDEDALANAKLKREAFLHAADFYYSAQ